MTTTITRKAALDYAIANLPENEYTAVLAAMLTQLNKPRKAAVSKARLMNENLAHKVAEHIPAEGITTKAVVNLGYPEILTTQKASAVLRVACDLGIAEKVVDGKKVYYKAVDPEEDAE